MRLHIVKNIVLLLCLALLFTGCGQDAGPIAADQAAATPAETPAAATPAPTPKPSRQINTEIESAAVADNMLEEPSSIEVRVYLPPSYFDDTEKRYPVVYFLHGYSGHPGTMTVPGVMDRLMGESGNEFIIVEPSGHNSLGGSFYVNSPVTGRWEDFITDEVIAYIDGNYRTIHERWARGMAGFSMGGYGAVNLALRHPDIYGCMLAYSPGLLVNDSLQSAFALWDPGFERAYGAAFSPDLVGESPYAGIPQFDGTDGDTQMIENWLGGFGNIDERIDAYLALGEPLNAIKIVVGTRDSYPWIPEGCMAFKTRMEALGVPLSYQEHDGGHTVPMGTLDEDFIAFFAENLTEQQD